MVTRSRYSCFNIPLSLSNRANFAINIVYYCKLYFLYLRNDSLELDVSLWFFMLKCGVFVTISIVRNFGLFK